MKKVIYMVVHNDMNTNTARHERGFSKREDAEAYVRRYVLPPYAYFTIEELPI